MSLTLATALALAGRCATDVAPTTLLSVAQAESGLNPLAIHVNGGPRPAPSATVTEASATAARFIAAGYSVDLGIAQLNHRNLPWLGMTIKDAFDPCHNLAGAAAILRHSYRRATGTPSPSARLAMALSLYNTGDPRRGLSNGYVGRVYKAASALGLAGPRTMVQPRLIPPDQGDVSEVAAERATSPAPAWVAFGNPRDVMVFQE